MGCNYWNLTATLLFIVYPLLITHRKIISERKSHTQRLSIKIIRIFRVNIFFFINRKKKFVLNHHPFFAPLSRNTLKHWKLCLRNAIEMKTDRHNNMTGFFFRLWIFFTALPPSSLLSLFSSSSHRIQSVSSLNSDSFFFICSFCWILIFGLAWLWLVFWSNWR